DHRGDLVDVRLVVSGNAYRARGVDAAVSEAQRWFVRVVTDEGARVQVEYVYVGIDADRYIATDGDAARNRDQALGRFRLDEDVAAHRRGDGRVDECIGVLSKYTDADADADAACTADRDFTGNRGYRGVIGCLDRQIMRANDRDVRVMADARRRMFGQQVNA